MTLIRNQAGRRKALIENTFRETAEETGISVETLKDTGKRNSSIAEARVLFVSKLPGINTGEIADYTGWKVNTLNNMRRKSITAKRKTSGAVRRLTGQEEKAVDALINDMCKRHSVTMSELNHPPTIPANATPGRIAHCIWEIYGRTLHDIGLNRATAKRALKAKGLPATDQLVADGNALCEPIDGVSLADMRFGAYRVSTLLAQGTEDGRRTAASIADDLRTKMAPYAATFSGGSTAALCVEENAA